MNTTDELLDGLAQRGVKYKNIGDLTLWLDESGVKWCTQKQPSGALHLQAVTLLTPEQAINATLGPKTCHNASEYPRMFFCCSECGCSHKRNRAYVDMPRFCPNCGRKVVNND